MSRLPAAFHQDKALRDAARGVLIADVEHARATLSGKAIAGRVAGRVGDGAKDVLEVAKGHASSKQGLIAGAIAILFLWFARGPIAEILGLDAAPDPTFEDDEPPCPEQDTPEEAPEADLSQSELNEPKTSDPEELTTGDTA